MANNEVKKIKINRKNVQKAKVLFKYIIPYKKHYLLGLLFISLSSISTSIFPFLLGKLIDVVSENKISQSGFMSKLNFFNTQLNPFVESFEWNLNAIVIFIFIQLSFQFVFSYMRVFQLSTAGEKTIGDIKKDVFKKLIFMPVSFFLKRRVGELNSRISTDLTIIQDTITFSFAEIVRGFFTLIIATSFIFWISTKLALLMIACISFVLLVGFFFSKKIRSNSKEIQLNTADSNIVVQEALQGIVVVKTFLREMFELKRYYSFIDQAVYNAIKNSKYRGLFISIMIFGVFGSITIVLWYGALLNSSGELTTGKLTMFVIFSVFVGTSFFSFADVYAKFQKSLGATEEVREILLTENEEKLLYGMHGHSESLFVNNITIKNLTFSYPETKRNVLVDVSMNIPKGKKISIIGMTGSGKSTISNLLLGLYPVSKKTIFFDNKPIEDIGIYNIRDKIGVITQDVFLFGGSVKENILYGNVEVREDFFNEVLEISYCNEFIHKLPQGIDTIVGERGIKLSGGQKQRIAIARTLLKNSDLLIFDEATSSLDLNTEREIFNNIFKYYREKTVLFITHRVSSLKSSDIIFVFHQGKVVSVGSYNQLLEHNGNSFFKSILATHEQEFGQSGI